MRGECALLFIHLFLTADTRHRHLCTFCALALAESAITKVYKQQRIHVTSDGIQLYSICHNVYSLLVSHFLLELPQTLCLLHFIVVLFPNLSDVKITLTLLTWFVHDTLDFAVDISRLQNVRNGKVLSTS